MFIPGWIPIWLPYDGGTEGARAKAFIDAWMEAEFAESERVRASDEDMDEGHQRYYFYIAAMTRCPRYDALTLLGCFGIWLGMLIALGSGAIWLMLGASMCLIAFRFTMSWRAGIGFMFLRKPERRLLNAPQMGPYIGAKMVRFGLQIAVVFFCLMAVLFLWLELAR